MHLILNEAKKLVITNCIYYVQYVRSYSIMQSLFKEENFLSLKCGERLLEFVRNKFPEYEPEAKMNVMYRKYNLVVKAAEDGAYIKYKYRINKIITEIKEDLEKYKFTLFVPKNIQFEMAQLCKKPQLYILKLYMKKRKAIFGQFLHSLKEDK